MKKRLFIFLCIASLATTSFGQKKKGTETEEKSAINSSLVSGLKWRSVGPALTAGRIADIAVNPNNPAEYYLAIASGGVFKTTNAGTTYEPIFDSYGSYSIGCVTLDPNNSNVVWVGTGENNNQRSVAFGDGIYKSEDGGKSFKNLGLKNSEHISDILVDPRNSNVVYVAAYGPLWSAGGDRGVYKTTDGGKNWKQIFKISENTGCADLVMDPNNPDVLYAAMHQRRRHVWTYVGGGPESGVFKTMNGGENWEELTNGLPQNKMGRVGLAISPVNSNYVYAIVEAKDDKHGFYRSTDRGASFSKMSSHSTSGNYYQEIYCDPKDVNKVFSMDTWLHHTEDGGKTFKATGEENKHVDNHCIWIDPQNTDHWLVGCDGGLYETWDHANKWHYKPNLPITQFYKVAVDNAEPFYNIYGGTQDNNSQGGPSRTINNAGITNADWFITNGGDGFESAIDPVNPNIVYAQAQYGWIVRYDKTTGQKIGIQPMPLKGEEAFRWNWDAPLLVSPHDHKTLYFAANRLFKSTDYGDTWERVSPDLTRQIDRNKLKEMGKTWGMNTVMKNKSTSMYGNIVALDESPLKKGLLYVGTDDGLIQVSEDDGKTWRQMESFPGIPAYTYVNMLIADKYDENVVYAVFNNHKSGDFKPYILKSADKGNTWTSISGNLPERGSVYAMAQDHVNKNLLFCGTEFGFYFSIDGGKDWVKLTAGLPTVAIRDIAIQARENDLVVATFGRSFYVLDDYSVLRDLKAEDLDKDGAIYPIKDAWHYVESNPIGLRGKSSMGASYFTSPNPDFGATFTYYIKEKRKTAKEKRTDEENKLDKDGKDVPWISIEEMRKEDLEEKPFLLFIIRDAEGNEVNRIKKSVSKGINRVTWNLRSASTSPIKLSNGKTGRYSNPDDGYMVKPGKFNVQLFRVDNGEVTQLSSKVEFNVKSLNTNAVPSDPAEMQVFTTQLSELNRSVDGASRIMRDYKNRLAHIKQAVIQYPGTNINLLKDIKALEEKFYKLEIAMWGDGTLSSKDIETVPSISDRVGTISYQIYGSTANPTTTQKKSMELAKEEFVQAKKDLDFLVVSIKDLEKKLAQIPIPYTPGRGDEWKEE
ncbi:MAG: glycosyl hydrolase [Crocinitomicaceae bacterium]|nr:glycosyl hydrolase [Crocinitomicaceae bacterium]